MNAALELRGVTAAYEGTTVLRDVDLQVRSGEVCALLGPNGAGKTTAMRVAAGLVRPRSGSVLIHGEDVTRLPSHRRRRRGLCLVPEGRGVFPSLTVRENLAVQLPRRGGREALDRTLEAFPILADRLAQRAGTMSGGQQQMLALARCYLRESSVILVDEVSMGLAPLVVDEMFEALAALRAAGCALVIVEQYVDRALALADHVVVLSRGSVVLAATPDDIDRDQLMERYLGIEVH